MAKDLVGIFNLALSAAGTQSRVSLPTENSREASICNLWYESVRDQILCAAWWSSAKDTAILALQAERSFDTAWAAGDPEPQWLYRYALPSDYLYPRFLENFELFSIGDYAGQPVLFTNAANAVLIYTKKQANPGAWSADLYMAIVQGLSAHIAMSLHGKVSRAQQALGMANNAIIQARINNANESNVQFDSVPDWLLARGVSATSLYSNFVFQYGPLLSVGGFTSVN